MSTTVPEPVFGCHSFLLGRHVKTIWTENTACKNAENCFSIHYSHTGRSIQTEFGITRLGLLIDRLPPHLLSTMKTSSYATYNDIEELLESSKEDTSTTIGKRGRSYREILSQKMCNCNGGFYYCRKNHSLEEILDIFRDVASFYQTAYIKSAFLERGMDPKIVPVVRDKSSFLCNNRTNSECTRNLCLYEYSVSLLHKYNNQLDYPICHITCIFCRRQRSVSIYI